MAPTVTKSPSISMATQSEVTPTVVFTAWKVTLLLSYPPLLRIWLQSCKEQRVRHPQGALTAFPFYAVTNQSGCPPYPSGIKRNWLILSFDGFLGTVVRFTWMIPATLFTTPLLVNTPPWSYPDFLSFTTSASSSPTAALEAAIRFRCPPPPPPDCTITAPSHRRFFWERSICSLSSGESLAQLLSRPNLSSDWTWRNVWRKSDSWQLVTLGCSSGVWLASPVCVCVLSVSMW